MSAVEKIPESGIMPFALRPMEEQDVLQAAEVERDAFPTLFPPTSFRRELKNRLARYLIAWRREDLGGDESRVESPAPDEQAAEQVSPISITRLLNNARNLWSKKSNVWQPGQHYIAGFLGTWYMVDEAHIVSVGVRSEHRGNGIGELLLIGAIEQALVRRASAITLEVRVSNYIAQNLYTKYGFTKRGVRKAYYTDNREDALIMTTGPIQTSSFRLEFQSLVQAHELRWGYSDRVLF